MNIDKFLIRFCYRYVLSNKRGYFWDHYYNNDFGSCRYEIYNFLRLHGIYSRKYRKKLISALNKAGLLCFKNPKIKYVLSDIELRLLKRRMKSGEYYTCLKDTTYFKSLILFNDCTYEMSNKIAKKIDRLIDNLDTVWFCI